MHGFLWEALLSAGPVPLQSAWYPAVYHWYPIRHGIPFGMAYQALARWSGKADSEGEAPGVERLCRAATLQADLGLRAFFAVSTGAQVPLVPLASPGLETSITSMTVSLGSRF